MAAKKKKSKYNSGTKTKLPFKYETGPTKRQYGAVVGKDFIVMHKEGDLHTVDGIECKVAFVNHGDAWLVPVKDYAALVARHIAFAKINSKGEVKKL